MSTSTSTNGSERPPSDLDGLWAEALWGVGLIGGVLVSVVLIATIFGR